MLCCLRRPPTAPLPPDTLADWGSLPSLDGDTNGWAALAIAADAEASRLVADAGAGDWQRRHAAAGPAGVDVWSRPVAGSPMLLTLGRTAFAGVSAPALLRVFASQDGYDLIDPYAEDHSAAVRAVWRDDAAGRVELCQTVSKPPCPREFLTLNQADYAACSYTSYSVRCDAKFPELRAPARAWNRFAIRVVASAPGGATGGAPGGTGCVCLLLNWLDLGGDGACTPPAGALNSFLVDKFLQGVFSRTRAYLAANPAAEGAAAPAEAAAPAA